MNSNNEIRIQSLQQLKKELLKYKSEKNYSIGTNKFVKKMQDIYGLFGSDNSFVFVRQKCVGVGLEILQLGFSIIFDLFDPCMWGDWIEYYLKEVFTGTRISDKHGFKYNDGDTYWYNGTKYRLISLSKIIPADFLVNMNDDDMYKLQDRINLFLADNPNFINQTIFGNKNVEQNDDEIDIVKTKFLKISIK